MTVEQARQVLGLRETASLEEARRVWRRLARKHHPDHGGREADFVRCREAWEVLLAGRSSRAHPPVPSTVEFGPGAIFEILAMRLDGVPLGDRARSARFIRDGDTFVIQVEVHPPWTRGAARVDTRLAWQGEEVVFERPLRYASRDRKGRLISFAFVPLRTPG